MNVISRGDGVADHQEAWTQGTEWKNVDYGGPSAVMHCWLPVLTYGFSFTPNCMFAPEGRGKERETSGSLARCIDISNLY
jgi:hypothetical protein